MTEHSPILLYDGTCGFCAWNVQFILRHDRRERSLRFASLQSETGAKLRARHPELLNVDSVIWFEPGSDQRWESVLVRSDAVLRVLQYIGGVWGVLAAVGSIVPRFLRDGVYDLVARNRRRFAGAGTSCLIPTAEERVRFLDR